MIQAQMNAKDIYRRERGGIIIQPKCTHKYNKYILNLSKIRNTKKGKNTKRKGGENTKYNEEEIENNYSFAIFSFQKLSEKRILER